MRKGTVLRWGAAALTGAGVLAFATPAGASNLGSSAPPGTILKGGQVLKVGTVKLAMLANGDLVEYSNGSQVWDSGTGGNPGAWAVMQTDGNFVVYSAAGDALWATGTNGDAGDCVIGRGTAGTAYSWSTSYIYLYWPQFSVAPCYIGNGSLRVAVVGDSITYQNQNAFVYIGYGSLAMQISGESGLTLEQQVAATASLVANPAGPPSAFVLELGANDAIVNDTSWQTGWNDELSAIGNRCTVFVSVNQDSQVQGSTGIATAIDSDMEFDAYVDSAQYHYLDPGWGTNVTLQSDGVHPDSNGQATLASEEVSAVQRDCG